MAAALVADAPWHMACCNTRKGGELAEAGAGARVTIHPAIETFEIGGAAQLLPPAIVHEPLRFDFVRSVEDLDGLEADWNALFERSGLPTQVFQTHAWVALWAKLYMAGSDDRLAILTARRGGRLVMVWPMVEGRGKLGRIVEFAGSPVSQYGDVLAEGEGEQRLALLREGWRELTRRLRPDLAVLGRVRADAVVSPLIEELRGVRFSRTEAPFLALAAGSGGESFEARQKGSAKRNRRRLRRRLEQGGKVTSAVRSRSAEAAADGIAALAQKRDWIVRTGLYSRAFSDTRIDALFAEALADSKGQTGAVVFSLKQGDKPVAYAIGLVCKTRLTLHVIVHDPDFDDCGAGLLNLEACLRHAEREGLETFDLLPPRASYKMQFAAGTVVVADHAIALTARGTLVTRVWYGLLRDRAKSALARMPAPMRKLITKAACRPAAIRADAPGAAAIFPSFG